MTRAFGGPAFNDLARQHEKSDDAGSFIIARSKCSEHSDANQFVDAQNATAQVFDRGPNDGITKNNGPDHGTGAGGGMTLFKKPIHHKSIEDEDDPDDGLFQPHRRVLVIVATRGATFVIVVMIIMIVVGILLLLT